MDINEWALAVSMVATLITALAFVFTIKSFKQQLQLQFFADYTKRYQEIILNLPEYINSDDCLIDAMESDVKDKTLRYMRAYFDLCSEEYFLWKNNYIDNETWSEWRMGIEFAFSRPAFKQAWDILCVDTIYYGDFKRFINDFVTFK